MRPLALNAHIFVGDAEAAVAFYCDVFGAAELFRNRLPDGRVLFVELAVGPAKLLISETLTPDEIARRLPPSPVNERDPGSG